MKKIIVLFALVITTMVAATSATAAPPTNQTGLVNLAIGDVTLQIPIGLAANACDLNVAAILALIVDDGTAACTAVAESAAISAGDGGDDGAVNQVGLINVATGDIVAQVPVAAALNICDLNIAALAAVIIDTGETSCEAAASSHAKNNKNK